MSKLFIVSLALFAALVSCDQRVPIPPIPDGVSLGQPNALVELEAFYDMVCPDSQAAQSQIDQVLSQLYKNDTGLLKFTIHLFPLPYHRNAFVTGIAARLVNTKLGAQAFYDYINQFFAQQAQFFGANTTNMTDPQVVAQVAQVASAIVQNKITADDFTASMTNVDDNMALRTSWKYGCTRAMTGTPIFMLNGVIVEGADAWSTKQWISFLQNYIPISQNEDGEIVVGERQD